MLKNIIPTLKQLREHEIECRDVFLLKQEAQENAEGRSYRSYYGHYTGSYCVSCYHNSEYSVTFCIWNNDYGACPEIGLRNLKTDKFELNKQSHFSTCALRFIRLARLIQAGRELKI